MKIEQPTVSVVLLEATDSYAQNFISQHIIAGHQGSFAIELAKGMAIAGAIVPIEGLAAGMGDKQQFRQLTPAEIVARSMDIAALLFDDLAARDWIIPGPSAEYMKREHASAPGFGKRGPG